jgi:hypothetical protein
VPRCGKGALAGLSDGVSASALGPRLEAHIAVPGGVYRLSRRQIAEIVSMSSAARSVSARSTPGSCA